MKKVVGTITAVVILMACGGGAEKKETTSTNETAAETAGPASNPDYKKGLALVAGSDCLTCHKADSKLIGPSYQEIATKYKETDTDLLADKIVNGGSGVWGDIPMAAHPGLDKENAKKMVKYILSLKK
jgi:cytochrome c